MRNILKGILARAADQKLRKRIEKLEQEVVVLRQQNTRLTADNAYLRKQIAKIRAFIREMRRLADNQLYDPEHEGKDDANGRTAKPYL